MASQVRLQGVLRMYINSLIVNCQGDPSAKGEDYPTYEQILESHYALTDDELESDWIEDSEVLDYGFGKGGNDDEQHQ